MINDLYSAKILTLAANLPHSGRLSEPEGSSEQVSKLCGSRVTVDLSIVGPQDTVGAGMVVRAGPEPEAAEEEVAAA